MIDYDRQVGLQGLSAATRQMIEKFGGSVESIFEEGAEQTLLKEPVVVIGTHAGRLDASAILAAMPERTDSFLIGNSILKRVGPNFREHLIDVKLIGKKRNAVKSAVKKLLGLTDGENNDPESAKVHNKRSLEKAGQIIIEGGRVLIFPDNVFQRGTENKWRLGIGRLLKDLSPDTKVVFAKTEKGKRVLSKKVNFSQPKRAGDFQGQQDESLEDVSAIVSQVQSAYANWTGSRERKGV